MEKQWIVQAHSDWLVKLQISFAIYLQATQEKMVSQFASVTGENSSKLFFCGVYYLTVSVYTKNL